MSVQDLTAMRERAWDTAGIVLTARRLCQRGLANQEVGERTTIQDVVLLASSEVDTLAWVTGEAWKA